MEQWKNFQVINAIYNNEAIVSQVQFNVFLTGGPQYGVVKFTPYSHRGRREANAHMALSYVHKGVIPQFTFYMANDHIVEVMEYASGGTLENYIRGLDAPLGRSEFLLLAYKLVRIIEDLHTLHWVHSNISPTNFVLGEKEEWKLIDFGKARHLKVGNQPITDPERATVIVQKLEDCFYDDIWDLGRTLYWTATRDDSLQLKPSLGQSWLLDQYVQDHITPLYDSQVSWLLQQMLLLNESDRASLGYIRRNLEGMVELPVEVAKLSSAQRCGKCHVDFPSEEIEVKLDCGDSICMDCYGEGVRESTVSAKSLLDIHCVVCDQVISYNELIRYKKVLDKDTKLRFYTLYYLELTTQCPRCPEVYAKTYKKKGEQVVPRYEYCLTCKESYCTLCRTMVGHLDNGYPKQCPKFNPEDLLDLIT